MPRIEIPCRLFYHFILLFLLTSAIVLAVGFELDAIATLGRWRGRSLGTLMGTLIQGVVRTYITFAGTLSRRWAKIVVGMLLLLFFVLQRGLTAIGGRRANAVVS